MRFIGFSFIVEGMNLFKNASVIPVCLVLVLLNACSSKKTNPAEEGNCTSTKEFITTLEYLRKHTELALPELDARQLAEKVALGCTGAAERFIKVASVLSKAQLSGRDAVAAALKLSSKSDAQAETFVSVFKKSFLADYLDLDMKTSVDLAHSLSAEFSGDQVQVRKDFEKFVDFCLEQSKLNLPRPQCAPLAARLAKKGEATGKPVFNAFRDLYEFMKSEKGPNLSNEDVVQRAEAMVSISPVAAQNFIQAYKFGVASSGLGLPAKDAYDFAKRMAERTQPTKSL